MQPTTKCVRISKLFILPSILVLLVYMLHICLNREATCSWKCSYIVHAYHTQCSKRSDNVNIYGHHVVDHLKSKISVRKLTDNSPTKSSNVNTLSVGNIGLVQVSDNLYCLKMAGKTLEELDLCTVDCNRTFLSLNQVDPETKSSSIQSLDGGCKCEDYMYCRLVAVTGFSSNHFKEAQGMIVSVQEHLPNTKLIVYDLGLTEDERSSVIKYCNVELRMFNYSEYPKHVSNVLTYAFKPLIANEVTKEYEVVLWMDASVRIKAHLPDYLLKYLTKFPFISGPRTRHASVSLTHNGMLEYLNITKSRKELSTHKSFPGTTFLIWANTFLKLHFLEYWVDCALHVECISPPGAQRGGCDFHKEKDGEFIGCHRFDQSALNMIMIREFGLGVSEVAYHEEINKVMMIQRHSASHSAGPSPGDCRS